MTKPEQPVNSSVHSQPSATSGAGSQGTSSIAPMPRGVNKLRNPFRRQKFEVSDEAFAEFIKYKPVPEPPERIQTTTRAGRLLSTRAIQFLKESVDESESRRQKRKLLFVAFVTAPLLVGAGVLAFQLKPGSRPPSSDGITTTATAPSLVPKDEVLTPVPSVTPSSLAVTSKTLPLASNKPSERGKGLKPAIPTVKKPPTSPVNNVTTTEPDEFDVSPFRKQR